MNKKIKGNKSNTNKRKQKLNRNKRKNRKQPVPPTPIIVIPPPPQQSSKTEAFLSGMLGSAIISACFQQDTLLSIGEFFVVDAIPFVTEHWESISTWVSNTFV